jgi:TPR repeat protein
VQYGLGLLFWRARDQGRAEVWLAKAAAQGHANAQSTLARLKPPDGAAAAA